MAVAAGMNNYPAAWRTFEVVRLYQRRASKVSERRLNHPPVANRDEVLEAVFVRSFDQLDDVTLALPKHDLAM